MNISVDKDYKPTINITNIKFLMIVFSYIVLPIRFTSILQKWIFFSCDYCFSICLFKVFCSRIGLSCILRIIFLITILISAQMAFPNNYVFLICLYMGLIFFIINIDL